MRAISQPRASNGKLRVEQNDGASSTLVHQLISCVGPRDLQKEVQNHQDQGQKRCPAVEIGAVKRCPDDVQQKANGQKDEEQGSQKRLGEVRHKYTQQGDGEVVGRLGPHAGKEGKDDTGQTELEHNHAPVPGHAHSCVPKGVGGWVKEGRRVKHGGGWFLYARQRRSVGYAS